MIRALSRFGQGCGHGMAIGVRWNPGNQTQGLHQLSSCGRPSILRRFLAFSRDYDIVTDNSLSRGIESDVVEYIMRRIRENYVTGSSCTIVLVGRDTWARKYVDWEIDATLQ